MSVSSEKNFFARSCSSCYYYVLVDIRRDANYYYCEDNESWLKSDFLNCSHYPSIQSLPKISSPSNSVVTFCKVYHILEFISIEDKEYGKKD